MQGIRPAWLLFIDPKLGLFKTCPGFCGAKFFLKIEALQDLKLQCEDEE
jgi:hypothetical protein